MAATRHRIGLVKSLHRYPVKSMAGETVAATKMGWHGLHADRRYGFAYTGDSSGFPWLSARDCPAVIGYRAFLRDPDRPTDSAVLVQTPSGRELDVLSPDLRDELQQLCGRPLHLMQLYSGIFDAMDLSLITMTSINRVAADLSLDIDPLRFRPNILVECEDAAREFPEDKWLGKRLVFGEAPDAARVRVNRKDPRCNVVVTNPATGVRDMPELLRHIVQKRKNLLGVYARAEWPGAVRVGESLYLME